MSENSFPQHLCLFLHKIQAQVIFYTSSNCERSKCEYWFISSTWRIPTGKHKTRWGNPNPHCCMTVNVFLG